MILGRRFVVKDVDGAVVGGDYGVEAAVVVQVADCHATTEPRLAKNGAGGGGDVNELFAGVAEKKHRLAVVQIGVAELDGVEVVALGDEQVFPAVVVVIQEADAPAGVRHGGASNA